MIFELAAASLSVDGRPVLCDVSFSVAEGERVVVLGVNGCGKSTMLKLLDGLAFATGGKVRYGGSALDARTLGDPSFRRRFRGEVGFLFQNVDAMLFNPTVADEIAFGPNMTTLTFHLSRALGRSLQPGDPIVVTELDHHANIDPWRAMAKERQLEVRQVPMDPASGTLDWARVREEAAAPTHQQASSDDNCSWRSDITSACGWPVTP